MIYGCHMSFGTALRSKGADLQCVQYAPIQNASSENKQEARLILARSVLSPSRPIGDSLLMWARSHARRLHSTGNVTVEEM